MSLWGAGAGSEGSLAVAAVKGPARGKGTCPSWSLGPGLNIKIRDQFRIWSSSLENRVNDRELLGEGDGARGTGRERML